AMTQVVAPPRAPKAIVADVLWYPPVGTTSTSMMVMPTSRNRLSLTIANLSATQTLKVATGTLDGDSTAARPSSGYVDVAPGQEYVTGDARPVWAYWPTTSEAVRIRTRTVA
ncbi:hypothetical protein QSJ18_19835, partial [Gordonia sp. ABSL1-1]|uniref:hypothetical protein n=1 Tax=Gordonia sp. ABSL1-1 TaxID=3053923 RepID=UPI00257326BA